MRTRLRDWIGISGAGRLLFDLLTNVSIRGDSDSFSITPTASLPTGEYTGLIRYSGGRRKSTQRPYIQPVAKTYSAASPMRRIHKWSHISLIRSPAHGSIGFTPVTLRKNTVSAAISTAQKGRCISAGWMAGHFIRLQMNTTNTQKKEKFYTKSQKHIPTMLIIYQSYGRIFSTL
jgi:hypothetical protein